MIFDIYDAETKEVVQDYDFDALLREHRELNAGLIEAHLQESVVVLDNLEEATRLHVRRVYEKYGKQISKSAEALGVARNTVRKYL